MLYYDLRISNSVCQFFIYVNFVSSREIFATKIWQVV